MSTDHAAFRRASRRLRTVAARARDAGPVWPEVGSYLSRTANRQWATRGAHLGTPWKPLAASTRLEKARLGYSPIPLMRTKTLRREFTGRPMYDEEHGKLRAFFGSGTHKARWHHRGTMRHGRRHIPPRPILFATAEQRRVIAGMWRLYIVGGKTALRNRNRST